MKFFLLICAIYAILSTNAFNQLFHQRPSSRQSSIQSSFSLRAHGNYGFSAGYLRNKQNNNDIKTYSQSSSDISTKPKSYGFSAGYLKLKESQESLVNDTIFATSKIAETPIISKQPSTTTAPTPPAVPVASARPAVEVEVPRRNYGFSANVRKPVETTQETSVPTSIVTIEPTIIKPSTPVIIEPIAIKEIIPTPQEPTQASVATSTTLSLVMDKEEQPPLPIDEPTLTTTKSEVFVADTTPTTNEQQEQRQESSSIFSNLSNINYEKIIKTSALVEQNKSNQIYTNLTNFNNIITNSITKKLEAENIIINELITLYPIILQELNTYNIRINELKSILITLTNTYNIKQKQIKEENILINDMLSISNKIQEKRILYEYNQALTKKQELLDIDTNLYNTLNIYMSQVSSDILSTQQKIHYLENKMLTYPKPTDREGMLKYSWSDISDIQAALLTAETTQVLTACMLIYMFVYV